MPPCGSSTGTRRPYTDSVTVGAQTEVRLSMTAYDFVVPFRTSRHDGFFNAETQQIRCVLGCKVRLLQQTPYHYLILEDVDKNQVPDLLQKLKRIMPWASLRLDFSV